MQEQTYTPPELFSRSQAYWALGIARLAAGGWAPSVPTVRRFSAREGIFTVVPKGPAPDDASRFLSGNEVVALRDDPRFAELLQRWREVAPEQRPEVLADLRRVASEVKASDAAFGFWYGQVLAGLLGVIS